MFLHELQTFLDSPLSSLTHALYLLDLPDHPNFFFFPCLLLRLGLLLNSAVVLLILLVEYLLSSLLELTLPLPVLIMQILNVLLHLHCFRVVLRPILILPFEQTQRQINIPQYFLHFFNYFPWRFGRRRRRRRNCGPDLDFILSDMV